MSRWERFKEWAKKEYAPAHREPKGIVVHEHMADFIHGNLIGFLLGFLAWLALQKFI